MNFHLWRARALGRLGSLAAVCALSLSAHAAPLSFDHALSIAEARAPMLAARRAAADGASSAQIAADALPDPKLTLGVENLPINGPDSLSVTRDFMTMRKIGVMQDVPNTDKRRARADAAQALTDRERALFVGERLAVRRETALAWLARHYLEQRIALFDELDRENRLLQDLVRAQLAADRAMPADAPMARQEAAQLAERRDELMRERAKALAALRRWVGEDAEAPLAGGVPSFAIDPVHLRANLHKHPALDVFTPMASIVMAEVREAAAMKTPDWGVELAYQKRGSAFSDMVTVQVSFDLPLFTGSRQDPRIAAKRKEVERIEAEREDALRAHAEELEAMLAEHDELSRKLARLREITLPILRERVELQTASYRAGKADLAPVLAARRDHIETRLKTIETEGQLAAVKARLTYLLGEKHS